MNNFGTRPLFLTGYAKSGTTLLLSLLDGHPELCVFPKETEFFTVAKAELEENRAKGVERFFERSFQGAQFGMKDRIDISIDKKYYLELLNRRWSADHYSISHFLSSAVLSYGDISGQNNRKWWVEKTPLSEQYMEFISNWYPDMKMIYVVRDPRANYSSIKRWRKIRGDVFSVARFSYEWQKSINQHEYNTKYFDVHTVKYEDLVERTSAAVQKICDFLEISNHPSLLRPSIGGKPFSGNSIYGDKFKGISRSSLEKWRHTLSKNEVLWLQKLLTIKMVKYGYSYGQIVSANWGEEISIFLLYIAKYLFCIYGFLPESFKQIYRFIFRRK